MKLEKSISSWRQKLPEAYWGVGSKWAPLGNHRFFGGQEVGQQEWDGAHQIGLGCRYPKSWLWGVLVCICTFSPGFDGCAEWLRAGRGATFEACDYFHEEKKQMKWKFCKSQWKQIIDRPKFNSPSCIEVLENMIAHILYVTELLFSI